MNPTFAIVIFATQGAALGVDEFIFHRARGLPRWERRGHPMDTFSVLLCLGISLLFPAHARWIWICLGFAIFSCLFVTKDEWVHASLCSPAEQWLHALLFLLHPLLLASIYALWTADGRLPRVLLQIETLLCTLFMGYQILYWNIPWRKKPLR